MTVTNQQLARALSCFSPADQLSWSLLHFCFGHRHEWTDADVMKVFGECCCLMTTLLTLLLAYLRRMLLAPIVTCVIYPLYNATSTCEAKFSNCLLIFFRTPETE